MNWNDDQFSALVRKSTRGMRWSQETIVKALQLRFICKSNGYKHLLKEGYPLPSIRTLVRATENFDFSPGVLTQVFELLKVKMEHASDFDKECMLAADEMAISEGIQFDPSTQSEIGKINIPLFKSANTPNATKALVFMLGGISSRWKQTVGYYFTGNSINPEEFKHIMLMIIERAEAIGLKVNSFTSDMGPCNQRLWRDLGVVLTKDKDPVNYITHPCDNNRKLYFFADVPHLFKNITQGFVNKQKIFFNANIVKKYNLKTNHASVSTINDIFKAQQNDQLKMTPRLGESNLNPTHFQKMNVMTSSSVVSVDVAATLDYFFEAGRGDESFETTSWFVRILRKWFDKMTSRNYTTALSQQNIKKYNEDLFFFKDVIDIFYNMHMGTDSGRWTPFQSGLILSTISAMQISEYLIVEKKFKYVLLGRFTQDCVENLFSIVRSSQLKPNAAQFKMALKLISISQYMTTLTKGNYDIDDRNYAVKFLTVINTVRREMEDIYNLGN